MKVYRKVVLDIITGETLSEDSYEYDGPVAECKGENKIFQSQQQQSFNNLSPYSQQYTNFFNTLTGYMGDRFGRQSRTFNTLTNRLNRATRSGVGVYRPGGGGGAGAAGRVGGGGGDGMGREGEGGGPNSLLEKNNLLQYGYDPSIYKTDYDPQRFYGAEEEALRSQASEEVAQSYENANQAFGARSLQLGQFAPGLEAMGLAELSSDQAAQEAAGQREVSIAGANNMRQEMAHLADLKAQLALGQAQGMSAAAQLRLQDVIARRQEALQKAAQRAASAAAGAANAERAREFNEQMRLQAAELQSNNFYRGIGAMSGLASMQDPMGYGSLGLQSLGGGSGIWGNTYGTASQGMVQTRSNPLWGQLLGGVTGGIMGGLTGGLSTGISGLFNRGGSGSTQYWNPPQQQQPWGYNLMQPGT